MFDLCFCTLQPHGFFNCSPAVDVPPSVSEMDKDGGSPKLISSTGLLAKL